MNNAQLSGLVETYRLAVLATAELIQREEPSWLRIRRLARIEEAARREEQARQAILATGDAHAG